MAALIGLLWLQPAAAQPVGGVQATYDIYAVGVEAATLHTDLLLAPREYRIDLDYHTVGLLGALFSGRQASSVQGFWDGDRPEPLRFAGDGTWRGQARHVLIDYDRGQPIVRSLVPPNDAEREPVPPELQDHAIDTLSVLALMIRRVAATGRCEAETRTFDGRRAIELTARTVGEERLAPTGRSSYQGPALRCDFEGRFIAGFMRDNDRAEAVRPQRGSAWLAQVVPGAPPLPVRISFQTRWFGATTMYLTGAGAGLQAAR